MTGMQTMRKSTKKIPLKVDWPNLRHDEELDKLLQPTRPLGVEFARKAERAMFEYMLFLHIDKLYVWDDFVTEDNMARWDFHYGARRPKTHACREHDFSNLWKMADREFEKFVHDYPKSPNEKLVREWRQEMRGSSAGVVPSTGLRQELENPDALDPIFKEKLL